jgi:hypothetical protein
VSAEDSKRLVRRLVEEAVAQHNPDIVDEIATGEFARAAKRWVSPFRGAFPDFEMELVEIYIFHVQDGKLSCAIGVEDNLSRMRQLGIRATN